MEGLEGTWGANIECMRMWLWTVFAYWIVFFLQLKEILCYKKTVEDISIDSLFEKVI